MFASEWHQQTQHELLLSLSDEIQAQKMDATQSKERKFKERIREIEKVVLIFS